MTEKEFTLPLSENELPKQWNTILLIEDFTSNDTGKVYPVRYIVIKKNREWTEFDSTGVIGWGTIAKNKTLEQFINDTNALNEYNKGHVGNMTYSGNLWFRCVVSDKNYLENTKDYHLLTSNLKELKGEKITVPKKRVQKQPAIRVNIRKMF